MSSDTDAQDTQESEPPSVISEILKPGSSLDSNFLAALDAVLSLLLLVLVALAYLSNWNIHLFFLIAVELALWASIKWFVYELQQVQDPGPSEIPPTKPKNE